MSSDPTVYWTENGGTRAACWRSQGGFSPPKRILIGRDDMKADVAYRLACEGTAILWRGDFHNARQMLSALARRVKNKPKKQTSSAVTAPAQAFHLYRMAQAQRARTLGLLLLPFEEDHSVPLRRAPDLRQPCLEAFGPAAGPYIASLRDLLGAIGAHEWRKKGVEIPALKDRIHPHYGVFSPVRGEYVELLAQAPLPSLERAFDIGTGTGVLAAVLARRGLKKVVATDLDSRALTCARDNIARLGLADQVDVVQADLFPTGRAPLVVCNPPWIPARPNSSLDQAVYDPDSRMLNGFLQGLGAHLDPGGEGWLILSDLAEHLGLRSRADLLAAFEKAGLKVVDRIDTRPVHRKAFDPTDPLHLARSAEVTSLWRLTG